MGRLFWKIFFTILLVQVVLTNAVGFLLWLNHPNPEDRGNFRQADSARFLRGPMEGGPFGPPMHPSQEPGDRSPGPLSGDFGPGAPAPSSVSSMPMAASKRSGPMSPPGLHMTPPFTGDVFGPRGLPWLPILISCVVSLICAALMARYLSRPIMALKRAFVDVAHGNFDVHPSAEIGRHSDELAELGREFEVTARQLRALIGTQRRLLHDVSHEVRSPLARMQLAIDIARQQPEKTGVSMERIERESARIDRLVGELLTLSRLEAGVSGAMDDDLDLTTLLAEVVEDARFEAEAAHRKVLFTPEREILIKGNGELLQRAFENVVRNAVRHTFENTAVAVSLREEDNQLRICVDDDGPGVPESALDTIFEPFVRYREESSNDGYGLGLAITRQTIEAHGGHVRAINRPHGGLRMEMTLPVPAAGSISGQ